MATHPLEGVVLHCFKGSGGHNETSIAVALGAPTDSPDAYKEVALDVLEILRKKGTLTRDKAGLYYRARPKAQTAGVKKLAQQLAAQRPGAKKKK